MKKTKKLLGLIAISAMLSLWTIAGTVLAAEPPSLPNPFGDAADAAGDTPPALELADPDTTPTPDPSPDPTPDTTTVNDEVHSAASLTKSGPDAYYLYLLVAASLAGGYMYNLKKERN